MNKSKDITKEIKEIQLWWFGHIMKREDTTLNKDKKEGSEENKSLFGRMGYWLAWRKVIWEMEIGWTKLRKKRTVYLDWGYLDICGYREFFI